MILSKIDKMSEEKSNMNTGDKKEKENNVYLTIFGGYSYVDSKTTHKLKKDIDVKKYIRTLYNFKTYAADEKVVNDIIEGIEISNDNERFLIKQMLRFNNDIMGINSIHELLTEKERIKQNKKYFKSTWIYKFITSRLFYTFLFGGEEEEGEEEEEDEIGDCILFMGEFNIKYITGLVYKKAFMITTNENIDLVETKYKIELAKFS